MNIPGFTAEASLYNSTNTYATTSFAGQRNGVMPAALSISWTGGGVGDWHDWWYRIKCTFWCWVNGGGLTECWHRCDPDEPI